MNPFNLEQNSIANKDIKRNVVRAGVTGAALAIGGAIVYGNGMVSVGGMALPAVVPLFAAGAVSSIIADRTQVAVGSALPMGIGEKLGDLSGTAIGALLCGASTAAILKVGVGLPNEVILPAIGLGAASYIAADYSERLLLEKNNMLIF